ncbi:hypothetical protein VE26_12665 [Devosia chinhatensis]|uniref:Release factor glutamine methyltransferase n=1 Tax=Devosia chinhatensis TaxID=429727 RepID=A0A0F5FJ82_9HYPH|nr:hypothetical protein VE26_12665 [Devosia chinhatensis]
MLTRLGFATAALDAKLLTGHALGLDMLALATRENEPMDAGSAARVAELIQRRMSGESVARIIGEREFYGLAFALNAATLEPRPDTELLVDLALDALPQRGRILDLGTGTGCIPIALLANRTDATGLAVDIDPQALAIARQNADRHDIGGRLDFALGDWFAPIPDYETFDLVVSNPPYIPSAVIDTLAPEVKAFDPLRALDGGPDGLGPYRVIAADAGRFLKTGGLVLLEIGFDQGAEVSALLDAHGFADVAVHKDLAGLDRVISAHHMSN